MKVLALDIATRTGWAIFGDDMDEPFFGTLVLPKGAQEVGAPMEAFRQFLVDQHRMHRFTHIVIEAQHVAVGRRNKDGESVAGIDINVVRKLIALAGMAEWFAHKIGAECWQVHIGTWRKHFLGRGTGMDRKTCKQMCLDQCRRLGFHPPDDDSAEAFGILDYFLSILTNDIRPWRDRAYMNFPMPAAPNRKPRKKKAVVEKAKAKLQAPTAMELFEHQEARKAARGNAE